MKTWAEYASGFGDLPSDNSSIFNYWIGNDFLNYFTTSNEMAIQFNFKYCGNDTLWISTYSSFTVLLEKPMLKLCVASFSFQGCQWSKQL